MRRTAAAVALATLVALAGCQAATFHGGMTVEVRSVEATVDGYVAKVTLTTWGDVGDNQFDSPGVVGYDADGEPVCWEDFDTDLKTGTFSGAKRAKLDCERFPVVFSPVQGAAWSEGERPLGLSTPTPTPTNGTPTNGTPTPVVTPTAYLGEGMHRYVVSHRSAVYVGTNETRHVYETTGESPLPYAKCRQRVRNANVSVLGGPTPWMDWSLRDPRVNRSYRIELELANEMYSDTATEFDDPKVDPAQLELGDGERSATLRETIDAARSTEDWQSVERSLTREEFLETAELVLMRPVVGVDDIPTGEAAPDHAEVWRDDDTHVECPEGRYEGDEEVTVTAVVKTEGSYWRVTLTYVERWSGPAFDRS